MYPRFLEWFQPTLKLSVWIILCLLLSAPQVVFPPTSVDAGCVPAARYPCNPRAEGVRLDVVPLQLLCCLPLQPPPGLWAVGRSWPHSPGRSQQPSPSPLLAASVLMDSKPTQCATSTHLEALTDTKHQGYKSTLHISQPPGLMSAEIRNCLYCMYGHLGYCFQNYFWQRDTEGEGAVFERRNNASLEGVSFGHEDLLLQNIPLSYPLQKTLPQLFQIILGINNRKILQQTASLVVFALLLSTSMISAAGCEMWHLRAQRGSARPRQDPQWSRSTRLSAGVTQAMLVAL